MIEDQPRVRIMPDMRGGIERLVDPHGFMPIDILLKYVDNDQ